MFNSDLVLSATQTWVLVGCEQCKHERFHTGTARTRARASAAASMGTPVQQLNTGVRCYAVRLSIMQSIHSSVCLCPVPMLVTCASVCPLWTCVMYQLGKLQAMKLMQIATGIGWFKFVDDAMEGAARHYTANMQTNR